MDSLTSLLTAIEKLQPVIEEVTSLLATAIPGNQVIALVQAIEKAVDTLTTAVTAHKATTATPAK